MHSEAKFLVLLDDKPRALLFDSERHLLGEVIEDDGFIVDRLLAGATPCPLPSAEALREIVPAPSPDQAVRWFRLQ